MKILNEKKNVMLASLVACGVSLMACSDEASTKVISEDQDGPDQILSEDIILDVYRNLGSRLDDGITVDPCEGDYCSKSVTRKAGVVTADFQGIRAFVRCEQNSGNKLLYDVSLEDSVLVQIVSESAAGDQGDGTSEFIKRASELLKTSCSELGGEMVLDRALDSYECRAHIAPTIFEERFDDQNFNAQNVDGDFESYCKDMGGEIIDGDCVRKHVFNTFENKYWALFSDLVVSPCLGISVPDTILAVDPAGNGDEPPVENPLESAFDFGRFEMSAVGESTIVTFNGGVQTGRCQVGDVENVVNIDVALAKPSPSNNVASISVNKELASLVLDLPAVDDYCDISAPVVMQMTGDTLHVSYDMACEYRSEYSAGTCENIVLSKCRCTSDHSFILNSNFASAKVVEFGGVVYDVERKDEFEVAVAYKSTGNCNLAALESDGTMPEVTMLPKSDGRTELIIPQLVGDCSNRNTMSFERSGDTLVVTRLYNRNEPVTDCICANDLMVDLENSYSDISYLKIGRNLYGVMIFVPTQSEM